MRPISTITPAWIEAALTSAAEVGVAHGAAVNERRHHSQVFALLCLLLGHTELGDGVGSAAITAVCESPARALDFSTQLSVLPERLARLASQQAGMALAIRRGGTRLRTENAFTERFTPPPAADVPALLRVLDRRSTSLYRTHAAVSPVVMPWLAYGEMFALLAVHPLLDGNGRTARWLYAARLWQAGLVDPCLVLAIPMSFVGNGARFHLAAQLARSGEFGDLYANFADAAAAAETWFAAPVAKLCEAFAACDVATLHATLEDVRITLRVLMA